MSDKYDKAVEYLTENPGEIVDVWGGVIRGDATCLFSFVSPDGSVAREPVNGELVGCLTMIKGGRYPAYTEKLTAEIRADDRIPETGMVTVESLPIFAEWQRRIDKELGR